MRRSDIYQLYLVGGALTFLGLVFVIVHAQTQDAINATVFERMNAIASRLDRLETYTTAGVLAMIANFVAHLAQIHAQRSARNRRSDGDRDD